mgnify:CR=1 FL=1
MRLPSGARGFESLRLRSCCRKASVFVKLSVFSTPTVEKNRIFPVVCQNFTFYDNKGVPEDRYLKLERGILMNYRKLIINTLNSFGVNRSYTGFNYVVYGLTLVIEGKSCIECITKSLYLDIAGYYHTSWTCVEKNIRTIVNSVWDSNNTDLLELVFHRSGHDKKPTNKEFLTYLYDYIIHISDEAPAYDEKFPAICPVSRKYCESLNVFCLRLSQLAR